MDTTDGHEVAATARALLELDLQLRRHHYHSLAEDAAQLDLIELGAITNLEWDEKDGLWAQLDQAVTFDTTPTGSSICVYLNEDPIVTMWASPDEALRWQADWECDITRAERQRFLRRIAALGATTAKAVTEAIDRLRKDATVSDERDLVSSSVREWLAGG